MYILFALIGAVVRYFDGSDHKPVGSNAFIALTALGSAWWALQPHDALSWGVVVAVAAIASVALIAGRTNWYSLPWMVVRFGAPAVLVHAVMFFAFGTGAMIYIAICAGAGAFYPIILKANPEWAAKGPFDGPESIARSVAGACILGGLAAL